MNGQQTVINLSCCNINDEEISQLCKTLKNNTQVHSFLVNWNHLTDKGAKKIADLLRTNPYLKRVEFAGNPGISDEYIHQLQLEFSDRFSQHEGLQRFAINPHRGFKRVHECYNLDQTTFLTQFYDKKYPVVVRKAIQHAPAVQTWSPEYFSQLMKERETVLSIINMQEHTKNQAYTIKNIRLKMNEAIHMLTDDASINSLSKRLYVLKSNLQELHEIKNDISLPDFSHALTSLENSAHLWLGQQDTHTSLHFDEYDNIFLQIYGEKSITLFPPKDTPFLYPSRPNKTTGLRNLHRSLIPCTDMLDQFSKISKRATPYHVHVQPGDALYIPQGWWHEVRGLSSPTISVNYWFTKKMVADNYIDRLFTEEKWIKSSLPEKKNTIIQASKQLIQSNNPNYISTKIPFTMLQIAIQFNLIEAVKILIEHKNTELNIAPYACTPLFLSIAFGHLDILLLLLKRKSIVRQINKPFFGYGVTPLTLAAENGDLEIINSLINAGAYPGQKDDLDQTALAVAIKNKHLDCVTFLSTKIAAITVHKEAMTTTDMI